MNQEETKKCQSYLESLNSVEKAFSLQTGPVQLGSTLSFLWTPIMAGRSIKGHVANLSTTFLRVVNVAIVVGGAALIVIDFVLEENPSFPVGWGLIALGVATIISGIFGAISSGQGGCFGCHLMCLALSAAGLCATFVVILLQGHSVLADMNPKLGHWRSKQMLRVEGAVCFVLLCAQGVVLLLACLIHNCDFIDYYEDLEIVTSLPPNYKQQEMVQLQETMEEQHRDMREATGAQKLAERMRRKYGAWSSDAGSEAFDDFESQAGSRAYAG